MIDTTKVAPIGIYRVSLILLVAMTLGAAGCTGNPASQNHPQETLPPPLHLAVPDAGWHWTVVRVLEKEGEIWVLTQLRRTPGMSAQTITTLELTLPVAVPDEPRRVFVAGKTWAWKNGEAYEFVADLDNVAAQAGSARQRFPLRK